MAIVNEVELSRTVQVDDYQPTITREYHIHGVGTEQEAINALLASGLCPATLSITIPDADGQNVAQTLSRLRYEVTDYATPGNAENFVWSATARYSVPGGTTGGGGSGIIVTRPPEVRWFFSMYTDSATQRFAMFGQTKYGSGAPDFGSQLNVVNLDGRNHSEGAPVLVSSGMLKGSKTFTASAWNTVVSRARSSMCKINTSAFDAGGMTFAAGELLMVGAEVRPDSEGNVEVEFQFLFSPSASGTIDGIAWAKDGWQYIWFYSVPDRQDGSTGEKVKGVYVANVYQGANFGDLFATA